MVRLRAWRMAWIRGIRRLREKWGPSLRSGTKSGAVLRGSEHWREPGLDGGTTTSLVSLGVSQEEMLYQPLRRSLLWG